MNCNTTHYRANSSSVPGDPTSGQTPELYLPIAARAQLWPSSHYLNNGRTMWLNIFGRLKRGVRKEQADAALFPVYRAILEEDLARLGPRPQRFRDRYLANRLEMRPASRGIDQLQWRWRYPLVVVTRITALVLLIACANVAGLLIARGAGRRREIALRFALGASRWVLIRQFLMESVVLSVAGGLAGLAISQWLARALIAMVPPDSLGGWLTADIDSRVLLFAMALSILTGLLFGLAPAVSSTSAEVGGALKDQASATTRGQARLRRILVTAQMALSVVLLVSAGMFVRSFSNLSNVDFGFRADRLLVFSINPVLAGYKQPDALVMLTRLQDRLRDVPGVTSVGAAELAPFGNFTMSGRVTVEGYQSAHNEGAAAEYNAVSAGFFRTLGVPLVTGREFSATDHAQSPKVAIVNETFVRQFIGDGRAIGRKMAQSNGTPKLDIEIIGVVRDSKQGSMHDKPRATYYVPVLQQPQSFRFSLIVRAARDDATLPGQARAVVKEVDASLPIIGLNWMQTQVGNTLYLERLIASLSAVFGGLATLLAAVGLYGLIAYTVGKRTAEIGIRMALGANRSNILRLVLKDAAILVSTGLVVGVPSALAAGRLIESSLFGVAAYDPWVIGIALLVLALASLMAGYMPARRAASTDPLTALRHE